MFMYYVIFKNSKKMIIVISTIIFLIFTVLLSYKLYNQLENINSKHPKCSTPITITKHNAKYRAQIIF